LSSSSRYLRVQTVCVIIPASLKVSSEKWASPTFLHISDVSMNKLAVARLLTLVYRQSRGVAAR